MTARLLFLTTNLALGGAEIQVARLAAGLARRGWNTGVISLLPPTAFAADLAAAGVGLYSLDLQPGRRNLAAPLRLAALIGRLRPHILHAHMFHANLAARLARLFLPVPLVVSTIHSAVDASRRSGDPRRRDLAYRLTAGLSDATVAVSQAAARRYGNALVIPNGVDTGLFRPCPARAANGRFTFLAAGRLMWKKDYPTLLEAFAGSPAARLLIAGDGPDRAALVSLALRLGVDAHFLGERADMPALMNTADAFVSSSVVEGLPTVLIEAAACGLPAVATAAGGAAEVVIDGRTGFVVPAGNAPRLAEAMRRVVEMPAEDRARMSSAARERAVSCFDLERVLSRWEELYRELLSREAVLS